MYSFRESFQRSIYLYTGGEIISVAPYKGHAWNMSHTKCFDLLRKSFNGLHRHDLRQVHSALSRPSCNGVIFFEVYDGTRTDSTNNPWKNKQVETCFNILNCFLHQLGVTNNDMTFCRRDVPNHPSINVTTKNLPTYYLHSITSRISCHTNPTEISHSKSVASRPWICYCKLADHSC